MFFPPVFTRMEQTNHSIGFWITTTYMCGLKQVTSAASQRPVRRDVVAFAGDGYDMFYFQWQVEHRFRRMAILTPMSSP